MHLIVAAVFFSQQSHVVDPQLFDAAAVEALKSNDTVTIHITSPLVPGPVTTGQIEKAIADLRHHVDRLANGGEHIYVLRSFGQNAYSELTVSAKRAGFLKLQPLMRERMLRGKLYQPPKPLSPAAMSRREKLNDRLFTAETLALLELDGEATIYIGSTKLAEFGDQKLQEALGDVKALRSKIAVLKESGMTLREGESSQLIVIVHGTKKSFRALQSDLIRLGMKTWAYGDKEETQTRRFQFNQPTGNYR
jgi:hypothetical protein